MRWMWPTGGEIPPDELPPWHPHLRRGAALLDHAARGGSLLHRQEVRHEGHPVLRGVRPDALFALAIGIGLASAGTSTAIGAIDTCVPSSLTAACKSSNPASPAKKAGIRAGDKIIAVAGVPVHNWTQMGKALRRQPAGKPVAITVQRDGKQLTLTSRLAVVHGRQGSYLGVSPVVVFQ